MAGLLRIVRDRATRVERAERFPRELDVNDPDVRDDVRSVDSNAALAKVLKRA